MNPISKALIFAILPFIFFLNQNVIAQYANADEAKDYINDRLSHSLIQKIDVDGTVTISSPGQKYKFKLTDVSFNYNDGNGDDRVRVFGNECIAKFNKGTFEENLSRQSFLCDSQTEANEVIKAFRFLKRIYSPATAAGDMNSRPLKSTDTTFNRKSVGEAIDFINENLSYSMVSAIDENGLMTINAPDEIYLVDLKKAEFGYNDATDGSKVRIYGDFCIIQKEEDGDKEWLARKSFQASGRVRAYKVISVLYQLKATFTEIDPETIKWLMDPGPARPGGYTNIQEAIRYINARLSYSIVLGVEKNGMVTVNAPENVFRFNLREARIENAINKGGKSEWFPFPVNNGIEYGVFVSAPNGIREYDRQDSYEIIDEQVFQCGSGNDARDIIKAFTYIKGNL